MNSHIFTSHSCAGPYVTRNFQRRSTCAILRSVFSYPRNELR